MASTAVGYPDEEPTGPFINRNAPEDPTTQHVQAASEGELQDQVGTIEFLGKRFRLADNIGLMPLLMFANSAKSGMDSDDMDGMAAMYALIRDTVDQTRVQETDDEGKLSFDSDGAPVYAGPSDWQRFERHCVEEKADGEDLMGFIKDAMGVISARPRKRRGTSPKSSPQISADSKASSSLPGTPPPGADGFVPINQLGR